MRREDRRQLAAQVVDPPRLGHLSEIEERLGDVVLARQQKRQRPERRVQPSVRHHRPHRVKVKRPRLPGFGHHVHEHVLGQHAPRVPACEGVGVVRQAKRPLLGGAVALHQDGRREVAQHRSDRSFPEAFEGEVLPVTRDFESCRRQRLAAVGVHQPDRERDDERPFVLLPRRRRRHLFHMDREGAVVPAFPHVEARRAGLRVPQHELAEIAPACVLECADQVLDRHRLPVMSIEVEVDRLEVRLVADEKLEHPDDLGPLLVDGGGIEVVDLDVVTWPDRVRERAIVLAELARAQQQDLLDAPHRVAAQAAHELVLAMHRETFLEAELEPVAASDAVARPVMEVLVRDDALDQLVVAVRRRPRTCQHVLGVEDVEALVLHRSHVEVVHGDDVEHVEVVFAAVDALVPRHRELQRVERVVAPALVGARRDPDIQRHLPPACGAKPG